MPTYEFKCPNGHAFDRFFKTISAAPSEVTCPECGAVAARQLSGGAGLLFKGSGFYLTDYGKNAHRKPEPKKDTEKAESTKSEGGGTKAEGGKEEGTKAESAKADVSKAKTESPKPKSDGAKPKKE